jgi:starch phosphorylase
VLAEYDAYLQERPSEECHGVLDDDQGLIAYFSAEYGFHQSIPIYAGGLGILAGDYCKAMSNLQAPFVGVGLLYHEGYFTQRILQDGSQLADYPHSDASELPVGPARDAAGQEVRVGVELPGRQVVLRVWECRVGHIRVYLLDSDLEDNSEEDRAITYRLYGGGPQTRLLQEMVLGIGGVRALRALGLAPEVWHINEGHSAFLVLERCREHTANGMGFDAALELVAASTVFTTHTPVPAGHDVFPCDAVCSHFDTMIRALGIDRNRFLELGANPRNPGEFNMTSLALRGSRFRNGVSRIHGAVASRMESYLWPDVPTEENPIGYVTNGVSVKTFLSLAWSSLFNMFVDRGWHAKLADIDFWEGFIDSIPTHLYRSTRQVGKVEMLEYVRRGLCVQHRRNGLTDSVVRHLTRLLGPQSSDTLVIGFARRFATYKRATLPFRDLKRLAKLIGDPEHPVLMIFAGKAHPDDGPGQALLRRIAEIAQSKHFRGRLLLLENYNLSLAARLVGGVDVWLNVPEYPKEACGTSGMKAAINGALNLSVLDGWWDEAYDGSNGWAITPHSDPDPEVRDRYESNELLNILEDQVIPLYYERNAEGEPEAWIRRSKAAMKTVMPRFNTIRMALDYFRDYYRPAARYGAALAHDDAAGALELAQWKRRIAELWPGVRLRLTSSLPEFLEHGSPIPVEAAVTLNGLSPADVVVECLLVNESELGDFRPWHSLTLEPGDEPDDRGEAPYRTDLARIGGGVELAGLEHFEIRAYPHHRLLNHPFECGCMLWL